MTGIQLGGGNTTHNAWDKNYISTKEISHINNMTTTEKVWDWVCDAFTGTHRAEAKECMRELSNLEGKGASEENLSKLERTFNKLLKLTSADYAYVDSSRNPKEYLLGYFKKVNAPEIMQKWQVIEGKIVNHPEFTMGIHQNALLSEIESFNKKDLHQVPVYIAHSHCFGKLLPPLHAYIMTGEPGTQHVGLYGERNDLMRSKAELNDTFINELSTAQYVKKSSDGTKTKVPFEKPIVAAIETLKGQNFAFIGGLLDAIKVELKKTGNEALLTESHHRGLGYVALKCNEKSGCYNIDPGTSHDYKEDIRHFKQQNGPVKKQPVKLTTLQEVTREQRVYQDYLNEKLGLNGLEQTKASIFTKDGQKVLSESEKIALKARTMVEYARYPSNSPMEANCNRTATTYVQMAINREKGLPIDSHQEVKSGTKWALAGNTRRHIHNPIQKKSIEDITLKNEQDTAYAHVRSLASTLSNIKSFFTSKS